MREHVSQCGGCILWMRRFIQLDFGSGCLIQLKAWASGGTSGPEVSCAREKSFKIFKMCES